MKKYLWLGIFIIIAANLLVFLGTVYNRTAEPIAELSLTHKELVYNRSGVARHEDSDMLWTIKWRVASEKDKAYRAYQPRRIRVSKQQLLALGFDDLTQRGSFWAGSKALYWALEYNGTHYQAELKKIKKQYQDAKAAYQTEPNQENERVVNNLDNYLSEEKHSNSRLFFIEAAAEYQQLATKYQHHKNVVIVKGLATPVYYQSEDSYWLNLQHLLVDRVMVPFEHAKLFNDKEVILAISEQSISYQVDIKWGRRLEPWISGVTIVTDN